jgi:ATP-dependent exoDNAse (exonuclease V) alpha subunit
VRPTGLDRGTSIMAIYHHSVSVVKRSSGKSSIAAAAYRSGDKLLDQKSGLTHDYTRKSGVDKSMILSPVAADWISDREQLWNRVEAVEKRYDAQLAREVTLAIPIELSQEDKIELVCDYIHNNYVAMGMIADVNFHHLDGTNPHVHIMLTMRQLEVDGQGVVSFGNKDRSWNHKDLLIEGRENWAKLANQYLVNAGYPDRQIDHRSNADRGIEIIPQIHLGAEAAAMRDRGIATDRGNEYERIEIANNNIRERLERIYQSELETREAERELAEYETDQREEELYPNMDFSDEFENVDFSDLAIDYHQHR